MVWDKQIIENQLSRQVIGCAFKVHSVCGPGLLESAYRTCLAHELEKAGLKIEIEKPVPIVYDGVKLERGYRLDILVEDKLVLELKAVDSLIDIHTVQTLTYLRFGGYRLGLILNFRTKHLKDGIRRVVNGMP